MAKGQKRSNREIRKPKQAKAEAKPEVPFANRVKLSAMEAASRQKGKS
ncbi:hypothetical protein [Stappia indica]|uniref:Uncharacterized protein n=1 Tax=Stappia indica TaxID=538381 RepID=A0A285R600_9HYPH|nr:hypothetical protein [Stappia indica]MCC4243188.1 hypothetical protein [Stappia indica]SOB89198.1 hypothetical protein SAMN05421512_101106 [Stappia indica]